MSPTSRGQLSILLCFIIAPQLTTALTRFKSWFPRYEVGLNYAVTNNCSREYNAYIGETVLTPEYLGTLPLWLSGQPSSNLVNCILSACPEVVKTNFNSAAVVLGLMPAILTLIGPSIQETSTLLALGDRPLLALIICVGSPLIGLERQLHIRGAFRALKSETVDFGLQRSLWLTCFEYVIALGAIANIAEVTWELGFKVAFTWFQDPFILGVWGFVGLVVHLLGALALSTSISLGKNVEMSNISTSSMMLKWLRWRFSLAKQEPHVRVVVQPPSLVYFLFVGFITLLMACQIIFGTIIFSGILFISLRDAIGVFCRYMGSVIGCRILVMIELALIRDVVEMEDAKDVYSAIAQSKLSNK